MTVDLRRSLFDYPERQRFAVNYLHAVKPLDYALHAALLYKIGSAEFEIYDAHIKRIEIVFRNDGQQSVDEFKRIDIIKSRLIIRTHHIQRPLTSLSGVNAASHTVAQGYQHFVVLEFCYGISISGRRRIGLCASSRSVCDVVFRRIDESHTVSAVYGLFLFLELHLRICQFRQHLYQRFFFSVPFPNNQGNRVFTVFDDGHNVAANYIVISQLLDYSLVEFVVYIDRAFYFFSKFRKKLAHAHKLRGNKVLVHFQFSSRVISHVIRQSSLIAGREQRRQLYTLGRYDNRQVLNSNFSRSKHGTYDAF